MRGGGSGGWGGTCGASAAARANFWNFFFVKTREKSLFFGHFFGLGWRFFQRKKCWESQSNCFPLPLPGLLLLGQPLYPSFQGNLEFLLGQSNPPPGISTSPPHNRPHLLCQIMTKIQILRPFCKNTKAETFRMLHEQHVA